MSEQNDASKGWLSYAPTVVGIVDAFAVIFNLLVLAAILQRPRAVLGSASLFMTAALIVVRVLFAAISFVTIILTLNRGIGLFGEGTSTAHRECVIDFFMQTTGGTIMNHLLALIAFDRYLIVVKRHVVRLRSWVLVICALAACDCAVGALSVVYQTGGLSAATRLCSLDLADFFLHIAEAGANVTATTDPHASGLREPNGYANVAIICYILFMLVLCQSIMYSAYYLLCKHVKRHFVLSRKRRKLQQMQTQRQLQLQMREQYSSSNPSSPSAAAAAAAAASAASAITTSVETKERKQSRSHNFSPTKSKLNQEVTLATTVSETAVVPKSVTNTENAAHAPIRATAVLSDSISAASPQTLKLTAPSEGSERRRRDASPLTRWLRQRRRHRRRQRKLREKQKQQQMQNGNSNNSNQLNSHHQQQQNYQRSGPRGTEHRRVIRKALAIVMLHFIFRTPYAAMLPLEVLLQHEVAPALLALAVLMQHCAALSDFLVILFSDSRVLALCRRLYVVRILGSCKRRCLCCLCCCSGRPPKGNNGNNVPSIKATTNAGPAVIATPSTPKKTSGGIAKSNSRGRSTSRSAKSKSRTNGVGTAAGVNALSLVSSLSTSGLSSASSSPSSSSSMSSRSSSSTSTSSKSSDSSSISSVSVIEDDFYAIALVE